MLTTLQSLLSILKHRTVEKTVERCEFSIVDGDHQEDVGEDHDALESKLIIKLYCKHGALSDLAHIPPSYMPRHRQDPPRAHVDADVDAGA